MNNDYTFKFILGSSLFFAAIAGYFGGKNWAIGIGIAFLLTGLKQLWDQYSKNKKDLADKENKAVISTSGEKNSRENVYQVVKKAKPLNQSMDLINFEYRTAEGMQGFYTIQVATGITGNIKGWCKERQDAREFRIDRIINDSITRVETGEVMTVKEWRKLMRENNAKNRVKAS